MSFTKIDTNTDFIGKGAMSLADQPTISASELKRKFDEPAREVVTPKFNNLIDELEATTSAASLGAVAPTGRTGATVQAVVNSVSADLATLEGSVAQVIADDHTHSNKALLDSYTQSETDLADAVTKKHEHSNKSLLDSYTQTETDLADAVSKKHAHSNKALLDTYTQTETDLADAVSKKHSHSNKSVIDDLSDDGAGNLLYDGNPVGGGTVNNAYKSVKVDSTTITASGEDTLELEAGSNVTLTPDSVNKKVTIAASGGTPDAYKIIESAGSTFTASGADTFKINAGSNVTITALSNPEKGIQISATGGGQSTGDMLMTDYDSQGDVKTAGGIDAYVSAEIGKLDGTISGSAGAGNTLTAFSQTDGKVSATFGAISITKSQVSDFPAIPTITDTYSGTSSDGMSGKAVKSAIDALDVSDSAVSGQYVSAVSETDGKISVTRANLPSVPTITDTYSSTSHDGMSGVAVASAISGKADSSALDDWVATASVSSGSVSFSGIDDSGNYGYEVFFNITSGSTNKNPTAQLSSISGEGTSSMSLTYTTDADNGTNNAKLRRIK